MSLELNHQPIPREPEEYFTEQQWDNADIVDELFEWSDDKAHEILNKIHALVKEQDEQQNEAEKHQQEPSPQAPTPVQEALGERAVNTLSDISTFAPKPERHLRIVA